MASFSPFSCMNTCVLDVISLLILLFEFMDLIRIISSIRTVCEPKLSLSCLPAFYSDLSSFVTAKCPYFIFILGSCLQNIDSYYISIIATALICNIAQL